MSDDEKRSHIVIGGGIAGVSCAIALSRQFGVKDVVLVSASDVLKVVRNVSVRNFQSVLDTLTSLPFS